MPVLRQPPFSTLQHHKYQNCTAGDHARFDFGEPEGISLSNFVSVLPSLQNLCVMRLSPASPTLCSRRLSEIATLSNLQSLDILIEMDSSCASDSSGAALDPLTRLQALESAKLRCLDCADHTAVPVAGSAAAAIHLPRHLSHLARLKHLQFSVANPHQVDPPSDAVSVADRVQGLSALTQLVLERTADFIPAALSSLQHMAHLHVWAGGLTAVKPSAPTGFLIAHQMRSCAGLVDLKLCVSLEGGVPLEFLQSLSQLEHLRIEIFHGSASCRLAKERKGCLAPEHLHSLCTSSSNVSTIMHALSQPDICACGRCSLILICTRNKPQQE